ncbi:flocculation protein FLO11-like [Acanthaster planci]|uniref:Flocculation protein FLO11-like n=1 Tax=Acanthaster planci TaxID=133434 RepID=A0A8B7ZB46_ACAPL|nr:flocculation protein FLO11-like [Acanthaster planci]
MITVLRIAEELVSVDYRKWFSSGWLPPSDRLLSLGPVRTDSPPLLPPLLDELRKGLAPEKSGLSNVPNLVERLRPMLEDLLENSAVPLKDQGEAKTVAPVPGSDSGNLSDEKEAKPPWTSLTERPTNDGKSESRVASHDQPVYQGQNPSGKFSPDHQEDSVQLIPATEVGENSSGGSDRQSEDQEACDADDEELKEASPHRALHLQTKEDSSEQESTVRKALEAKMPQPSHLRGGHVAATTPKPADNLESKLSISSPRRTPSSSADSSTSSVLEKGREVPADPGVSRGDFQGNSETLRETVPSVLLSSSSEDNEDYRVDDEDLKDEKNSSLSTHRRNQLSSGEESFKQESTVREFRKPAEAKMAAPSQFRRSSSSLTDSSISSSSREAKEITVKRRPQDHQEDTNQKTVRKIMQKVEAMTAQDNSGESGPEPKWRKSVQAPQPPPINQSTPPVASPRRISPQVPPTDSSATSSSETKKTSTRLGSRSQDHLDISERKTVREIMQKVHAMTAQANSGNNGPEPMWLQALRHAEKMRQATQPVLDQQLPPPTPPKPPTLLPTHAFACPSPVQAGQSTATLVPGLKPIGHERNACTKRHSRPASAVINTVDTILPLPLATSGGNIQQAGQPPLCVVPRLSQQVTTGPQRTPPHQQQAVQQPTPQPAVKAKRRPMNPAKSPMDINPRKRQKQVSPTSTSGLGGACASSSPSPLPAESSIIPVLLEIELEDSRHLRSVVDYPPAKLTKLGWINICLDISRGLHALHQAGWSHNDLHTRNIMVWRDPSNKSDGNWGAKIIDLGMATRIDNPPPPFQYSIEEKANCYRNCMQLAPELIEGTCQYGVQTDVYSLGYVFSVVSFQKPELGVVDSIYCQCRRVPKDRPTMESIVHDLERLRCDVVKEAMADIRKRLNRLSKLAQAAKCRN